MLSPMVANLFFYLIKFFSQNYAIEMDLFILMENQCIQNVNIYLKRKQKIVFETKNDTSFKNAAFEKKLS